MAALLSVALALLFSLPPAFAESVLDHVRPCEGAGRDDLFNYCCKRAKRIRVAVIPDFQSSGYVESFMEAADDILGPHNIEFAAQVLQVDGMREITQAANMAELCRSALIQLGPHVGDGMRFRGVLPIIFIDYSPGAGHSADSNGMYIDDLRESCLGPLREWYNDKPDVLRVMEQNLPSLSVILLNSHTLEERSCFETFAHEIGHSVGLGHVNMNGNVMYACSNNEHRDKLTHQQVAAYCKAPRPN